MMPLPAPLNGDRTPLSLSEPDFARIAERIYDMAGIILEPRKKQMIYSRLLRRLKALNIGDFTAYLDFLDAENGEAEHQSFVNAITTNLTSFFRENHHFAHFKTTLVQERETRTTKRLRVWSAGCSTGEEAYSIALSIADAVEFLRPEFKVLATDIDTDVLQKARAGKYTQCDGAVLAQKYPKHLKYNRESDTLCVSTALKNQIAFRQLNLIGFWPMAGQFDAIFCRNVLIYFNRETKAALLRRLVDRLAPGGFLYLGHSEPVLAENTQLAAFGQTIYQKRF